MILQTDEGGGGRGEPHCRPPGTPHRRGYPGRRPTGVPERLSPLRPRRGMTLAESFLATNGHPRPRWWRSPPRPNPGWNGNGGNVQFTDGCVFLAACASGDRDEVLRLVKERGADIDTANVDGLTALHQVRKMCSFLKDSFHQIMVKRFVQHLLQFLQLYIHVF